MSLHALIFSDSIGYRVLRHTGFWLAVSCWYIIAVASTGDNSMPTTTSLIDFMAGMQLSNLTSALELLPQEFCMLIVYSYLFAYWIIPRYLVKGQYTIFLMWFLIFTLIAEIILLYLWDFSWQMPGREMMIIVWFSILRFVNLSPTIVCGLFVSLKMLKTWHLVEKEKLDLTRENATAELQLLKAQIHPHFLFNTLNNIYSFALSRSPKASELVSRLTDILEYMTKYCYSEFVPVTKEVQMIEDYLSLEKVRYGERLQMDVHIKIYEGANKLIPPFLLIPFVENSFKHGASEELNNPWISLTIDVQSDHLHFRLINSKPAEEKRVVARSGIGLKNVERRLALLFPDEPGLFNIVTDENRFDVTLNVPLTAAETNMKFVDTERSPLILSINSAHSV